MRLSPRQTLLRNISRIMLTMMLLAVAASAAQSGAAPNDGKSQAEARAMGYMRTVMSAQREYRKKHGTYASSLALLVGKGSFTRRMVNPDRGDYTARFSSTGNGYSLGMTPKSFDPEHRAFFSNETGTIRVESDKPANAQSPPFRP